MELGGGGWSSVEVGARFSNTHFSIFNFTDFFIEINCLK